MAKYRAVSTGSYGLKEEIHYLYYASSPHNRLVPQSADPHLRRFSMRNDRSTTKSAGMWKFSRQPARPTRSLPHYSFFCQP
jgi:hypothetical protein